MAEVCAWQGRIGLVVMAAAVLAAGGTLAGGPAVAHGAVLNAASTSAPVGGSAAATAAEIPPGVSFQVTYGGKSFAASLPPSSIATYTWTPGSKTVGVTETETSGGSLVKNVELAHQPSLSFGATGGSLPTVAVNPSMAMQKIAGFGGAMTQSSASLINNSVSEKKVMDALFGSGGAHFNIVRVPMGASDFVTGPIYQNGTSFSYDDNGGKADPSLANFSIGTRSAQGAAARACADASSPGEYGTGDYADTIPALLCAEAVNSSLNLLAVPWSAPGWMKIDDSTVPSHCTGSDDFLRGADYGTYTSYFLKYLKAYQSAGLPVSEISMQNEPENCSKTYPTMEMKPSDQAMFAEDLYSGLHHPGGSLSVRPTIMAYDHNYLDNPNSPWNAPHNQVTGYPEAVLKQSGGTKTSVGPVGLVGFHHYNGTLAQEEQALDKEHYAYPNVPIWMTEATGTYGSTTQAQNFVWEGQHDLMEALQNWTSASLYLNLILNSHGGPHDGGCGSGSNPCRGMVTLNPDGTYSLSEDYYDWAQFSKFIQPGATRICSDIVDLSASTVDACTSADSSWIPTNSDNLIDTVAFQNPNGSIVLVALNTTPDGPAASSLPEAQEVPGTAALNAGGYAEVNSVSCPSAGNCTAGGYYRDGSAHDRPFVVSEVNGTWQNAIEVPGTVAPNGLGGGGVVSVSCGSAGNCSAGGYYINSSYSEQAFVDSEVNGTWGTAIGVPGTALPGGEGGTEVASVSCASAGNCSAGGHYPGSSGTWQAFLISEVNGTWGTATGVPGTAALDTGGDVEVDSVSCGSAGNCSAGGYYAGSSGALQAFVVSEVNGTWGTAIEVPGTAALNAGGWADVDSVSCASAGNCSAGGSYSDSSSHEQAFVVSEVNGTWGTAIQVPGTAALNAGGSADVDSVSCASAGNCSAGGSYSDSSSHEQAFMVSEVNGTWGTAIQVPGTAALNAGGSADVDSVSCASAGNCSAGGSYSDSSSHGQAFMVSEVNGTWGTAIEVPGTAALNAGGWADVDSVSCGSAGNCSAGGYYSDSSSHEQAFVVSQG